MLEAEKIELEASLSGISSEPPMLLHPHMSTLYREKVKILADSFKADKDDREAFETIRALLDIVTLTPTEAGFTFDIEGELAQILALSSTGKHQSAAGPLGGSGSSGTTKPSELSFEGSGELAQQVKLVAGAGVKLKLYTDYLPILDVT